MSPLPLLILGGVLLQLLVTLGGVARGLMVGGALFSALLGCKRSGERALRNSGDPGSALFGRLMHFLVLEPGVRERPGE